MIFQSECGETGILKPPLPRQETMKQIFSCFIFLNCSDGLLNRHLAKTREESVTEDLGSGKYCLG